MGFLIWSLVMIGVVMLCINIDNIDNDGGK